MRNTPAYVIISLVFFIITGIVLGYSCFFYPNNHPVECVIKQSTGKDCPSCGFSRAFSSYTHLQFNEGYGYNKLSLAPFLFFCAQFFFRGFVLISYFFRGRTFSGGFIRADVIISISGFLLAFLPLLIKFRSNG